MRKECGGARSEDRTSVKRDLIYKKTSPNKVSKETQCTSKREPIQSFRGLIALTCLVLVCVYQVSFD